MPTRNQADFEIPLMEALEAIISNITKKLAEKFHYYDTKIASLEGEIQLLKSNNNDTLAAPRDNTNKLEQKVDNLQQQSKNHNI
nr:unnamed protein product [Callosobruchus chinensis]